MSYEPKLPLLLELDFYLFHSWDMLQPEIANGIPIMRFRKSSAHGITVRVYGHIGVSDLTGKPIVEDMKVMLGESDIYDSLPESLLREFEEAALEEAA